MSRYIIYLGIILMLFITACQGEPQEQQKDNQTKQKETKDTALKGRGNIIAENDSLVVDSASENEENAGIIYKKGRVLMDTKTFPGFQDPQIKKIMAGMYMCRLSKDTIKSDSISLPPCSPKLYRAFHFKKGAAWKEGFIVEVKSSVYSYTRMVIVIRKVNGKYTAVNQFAGKLVELTLGEDQYYSMLIAYVDGQVGSITIRHKFDGNKYNPVSVEEINNHYVKEKHKDSLYNEYIKNFDWGI